MHHREEKPTQELLEETPATQPAGGEPTEATQPMGKVKFLGRVVAEVLEKLPHDI